MSDSVLDRFSRPVGKSAEPKVLRSFEPDSEEPDDLGAFGWLRGVREKAIMLELRKKDGSVRAIGYAWLPEVEFDPSRGITLTFHREKIRIIGLNLNAENRPNIRLFQGIVRHRVPFIQETDQVREMHAKDGETVIERIEW